MYGWETSFKGTWCANPIHTINTNSIYIQAIETASFVQIDGVYGAAVVNGIENVQAKYSLKKTKVGVVDKATVDALIDNVKSTPTWMHQLNAVGYEMNIGEQFWNCRL